MNNCWRYFDYDYDQQCIVMSDDSDSNVGWVKAKEDKSDTDDRKNRYPVNMDKSTIATITV